MAEHGTSTAFERTAGLAARLIQAADQLRPRFGYRGLRAGQYRAVRAALAAGRSTSPRSSSGSRSAASLAEQASQQARRAGNSQRAGTCDPTNHL